MQESEDKKMYFYFDESGSPAILGHHGKNLLEKGLTSKTFAVGYIQTENPHEIFVNIEKLRNEIIQDEYFKEVPSIKNLKNGFHANKDCHEIREKVFKLLKKSDFEAYVIIARKSETVFRKKFNMSDKKLYKFLVAELLKNRVHLYKNIDIYFSEMGNTISAQNMREALNDAINKFHYKWGKENTNNIRVFLQQPSHLPLLQVADYILWATFQVFEHNEFRYFNYLKEKIKLVHDIFDIDNNRFYGAYYNSSNPLEPKKLSPISG